MRLTILILLMGVCTFPAWGSGKNQLSLKKGIEAFKSGDMRAAESYLRKAVAKDDKDAEAYYYLGSAQIRLGYTSKGVASLKHCTRLMPGNVKLRMAVGDIFAQFNQMKEAVEQFRMIMRLAADDKIKEEASKKISLSMVNKHTNNGDLDSAIFLLGSLADQYPNDEFIQYQLGNLYIRNKQTDKARKHFKALLRQKPTNLQARLGLAMVYQMSGNNSAAQKQLFEVVKRDPKGKTGKQAALSIAMQRTSALMKAGKYKQALRNYQEMLRFDPSNPVAMVNIADLAFKLNDLDVAQKAYERLARVNTNDANVHYRLGNIYYRKGMVDKTIKELETVVKISANSTIGKEAKKNLAALYQGRNKNNRGGGSMTRMQPRSRPGRRPPSVSAEKELATIDEVLKEDPRNVDALLKKADVYLRTNRLEMARRSLEKIVSFKPDYTMAQFNLGTVYENLGLTTEAEISFAKVVNMDKKGEWGKKAAIRVINLGAKRLFNQGKMQEAEAEFNHIIQQDKNDASAHYFLALIYQKRNQLEKTAQAYQEVIRINPRNLSARYNLGVVYEQLNKEDLAMREYRGIIRFDRKSNMAALAKQRLDSVENRINGFTFAMSYGVFIDDNTNLGKEGVNVPGTVVDEQGQAREVFIPLDPISDHRTEFTMQSAYQYKMSDRVRWGLGLNIGYNVLHDQEFDFLTTAFNPSIRFGRYRTNVAFDYTYNKSTGLLDEENSLSNDVENFYQSFRTSLLRRFRMRPVVMWLAGKKRKDNVATTLSFSASRLRFNSTNDVFDSSGYGLGIRLDQTIKPGYSVNMGYDVTDNVNSNRFGADFANTAHRFYLGTQKLLLFGVIAAADWSTRASFYKNADSALLTAEGKAQKRFILNNSLNLRLQYRYNPKMLFELGYTAEVNEANLSLRFGQGAGAAESLLGPVPSLGTYSKNMLFFNIRMNIQ